MVRFTERSSIVASSRAACGGAGNEDEAFAPIFPGGGWIVAAAPGWMEHPRR